MEKTASVNSFFAVSPDVFPRLILRPGEVGEAGLRTRAKLLTKSLSQSKHQRWADG